MTIVPRGQHTISRKEISKNALKVLYRLNKAAYEAYLVGGSVRDLLLGRKPKDFDITTSATPEQMRKLFRNCRLVGRRFRLAHVIFGQEIIEVSTFRGCHQVTSSHRNITDDVTVTNHSSMLLNNNIFGSLEEDAQCRDFSVNSLYYNALDFTLRDYTGGLKDLQEGIIRLIGDPETRYREDPVRMLRAVRFAAKLDMTINRETAEPIPRLSGLLNSISPSRLFEETLKLLHAGYGESTYRLLCTCQLFQPLFPLISRNFTEHGNTYMEKMIIHALNDTDRRLRHDIRISPSFLFAAILWYPLLENLKKLKEKNGLSYFDAFSLAMSNILNEQHRTLAIPKRLTALMRNIWQFQLRFLYFHDQYVGKIMTHSKFRAAYDLFMLRARIERQY